MLRRTTARDLGSILLVVIRVQYADDDVLNPALRRRTQADLATLSTDGMEIEALGSRRFVQNDDRGAVVAAVQATVAAACAATPLAPCGEIVAGVWARCQT